MIIGPDNHWINEILGLGRARLTTQAAMP